MSDAIPRPSMTHYSQVIYIIVSLGLLAGGMLGGATWYLSGDINAIAVGENRDMMRQWQVYEDEHLLTLQRVTKLEAEQDNMRETISQLTVTEDQIRAALTDETTAVGRLDEAVKELRPRR